MNYHPHKIMHPMLSPPILAKKPQPDKPCNGLWLKRRCPNIHPMAAEICAQKKSNNRSYHPTEKKTQLYDKKNHRIHSIESVVCDVKM